MINKVKFYSLFFFFGVLSGFSQEKKWTLDECIAHAIENNIQVKQIEISELNSEVNLELAQYDFLPTVNANAGQNWTWTDSSTSFGASNQKPFQDTSLGINVGIDILGGLQKQNTFAKARLENLAAIYSVQKLKEDISLSVISSYLQILFNRELVKTNKAQLAYDESEQERVSTLVGAGAVPAGDLLTVKATVASSKQSLIVSENDLLISKINLAQILQIRDYQYFNIADTNYEVKESELMIYSPEDIFQRAFEYLTNIKKAELNVEIAKRDVKISKSAYYPKLSGFYSLSTAIRYNDVVVGVQPNSLFNQVGVVEQTGQTVVAPGMTNIYGRPDAFFKQFDNNFRSAVGLSLTIPVFNGLKTRKGVKLYELALEQKEYEKEAEVLKLEQIVFKAYADVNSAFKTYEASLSTLEAREKSLEYARERYAVGLINIFELNQSQNLYVISQSNLLRAKYDYIFKNKILEYYFGVPLFKTN